MKATSRKSGFISLCITFCLISIIQSGCHTIKSWPEYVSKEKGYNHIPGDTTQQIIVWRTPNSDPGYLNRWLDSIYTKCGPFDITVFCGSCDSSLMLLTGSGIRTYIAGNGGGKGGGTNCTSNCPPSGGGDTIYWCVNFPVEFKDSLDYFNVNDTIHHFHKTSVTDTSVTVAVFDTGIDPGELNDYLYRSNIASCLDPTANDGWNFPNKNNTVNDNYNQPEGHGEIVSRLIAEQVNNYQLNGVKILPVKIHNERGESDLFSVLCGFAYAKERGAQIINASFGYYALKGTAATGSTPTDPGALLLKQYIKYYLTNNNILLIAAAGNKDRLTNDADERALYTNAGLPLPSDLRDLNQVNFYPASLAADPELPNVIAVTTVSINDGIVSPNQNHSENVVDIGVNADTKIGDDYFFLNPAFLSNPVRGSSFATPIVTGIICSHYSLIKNNVPAGAINKDAILKFLLQPGLNLGQITNFNHNIKTGVMRNNARY